MSQRLPLVARQASNVGDQLPEAAAQIQLGHARLALGDSEGAQAAFERAGRLEPDADRFEIAAGLAGVALRRGDAAAAVTSLEPVLAELAREPLDGIDDRFEVFLTAYLVLDRASDARAEAVLARAQTTLREFAGRITDPEIRRSFLEDVPAHWQLMSMVGSA